MTEHDDSTGSPSDAGERLATPATWPRDPSDRAQPRSRLHQALTVARRRTEPQRGGNGHTTGITTEAAPDSVGVFQRAFADILGEASPADRGPAERTEIEIIDRPPDVEQPTTAVTEEERPMIESRREVIVDLRDGEPAATRLATTDVASHYGLGSTWGRSWRDSAQGWVATPSGEPMWRPVVSTTHELATWDVDTYLGVVTAEVAVDASAGDHRQLGATLARGRELGVEGLVEEAIERGAHAVIGVTMQYTTFGERLLLTITGTAVTLREKRR